MAEKNCFGDYTLSGKTIKKLNTLKSTLSEESTNSNKNKWERLFAFEENFTTNLKTNEMNIGIGFWSASITKCGILSQATSGVQWPQEKDFSDDFSADETIFLSVFECVREILENKDETTSLNKLKELPYEQIPRLIIKLSDTLSLEAMCNLCTFICNLEIDIGRHYVRSVSSEMLLKKIIHLEKPSRMLETITTKLSEKFPEDIQKLIVIPALNLDLKDHTTIHAVVKILLNSRKLELFTDIVLNLRELKSWHISILLLVSDVKLDNTAKDRMIGLLEEKCLMFSADKDFSKLVLLFIKSNSPYTIEQKSILNEIQSSNTTVFKNVIGNILKTM